MKKIISVGAVLLAGAFATGCANSNAAGAPAAAVDSAPGRALYEDIALSLYGTPADRLAAEKDSAARFQGALGACMKNKGFTYHQVPSEEQNGGPISPGDLASIAEIGRGTFGIATAKHNQAVVADRMRAVNATSTSTGEQEAAYGKALGNCSTVAAKAEQAAPAGPVDLMKELTATFRDVEKTPAVAAALDAYGPCMTKAGFSAKSHVEIFQQAFDKFPRADLGVTAMENDPQWAAAVAYETEAAAADTTCLTPAQDLAFAAATPTLQAYVTKNRVALDAAKADLAELRR